MPPTAGFIGHTFVCLNTKREQKVVMRIVNVTLPDVPQWLDWSEQSITWSHQDYPP